jgi:hypothetical protein
MIVCIVRLYDLSDFPVCLTRGAIARLGWDLIYEKTETDLSASLRRPTEVAWASAAGSACSRRGQVTAKEIRQVIRAPSASINHGRHHRPKS